MWYSVGIILYKFRMCKFFDVLLTISLVPRWRGALCESLFFLYQSRPSLKLRWLAFKSSLLRDCRRSLQRSRYYSDDIAKPSRSFSRIFSSIGVTPNLLRVSFGMCLCWEIPIFHRIMHFSSLKNCSGAYVVSKSSVSNKATYCFSNNFQLEVYRHFLAT